MTNESAALSKQPSESRKVTLKWMALLAAHFRVDLSEPEIRIYCESLGNEDAGCLEVAFQRCLHDCEFLPKLKEVHDRMPPAPHKSYFEASGEFVPVKNYYEPYSKTARLHVWEDAQGNRRVAAEKIVDGLDKAR